jgi:2-dehydro-3-deoxygluconokinase
MIEFFADEPLDTASGFQRSFGGDTFNMIASARRLGTAVGYVTKIAPDAFGRYLLLNWEREGIDLGYVRQGGSFNGVYFIANREDGEREFTYYRRGSAASELAPTDLDAIDFAGIRAFHSSGITQALSSTARTTVLEGFSRAKNAGCITSFDLNYRPRLWSAEDARAAMEEVLPLLSVCFAGLPEDSSPLLGTDSPEESAKRLHDSGVPLVVLKRGAKGALISDRGNWMEIPARIYGVALDTTGAGDAFAGGFLHGLLEGLPAEEAGCIGSICAGLKVLGRGAVSSLPAGDAIRLRLQEEKGGGA